MTETESRITLNDHSELRLVFDAEGKPLTENEDLPGGARVHPVKVVVLLYFEKGRWSASLANVIGPKVHRSSGATTKRHYEVPFSDPLGAGRPTPDWVDRICRAWENRMNGVSP